MPATVVTRESFPSDVDVSRLEAEVALRLKAGAIRSSFKKSDEGWILETEWNVIGEQ